MALIVTDFKLINSRSLIVILRLKKVDSDNGYQEDKGSKRIQKFD